MKWRFFKLDWKYATGELIIVTLGVMIALFADQWISEQSLRNSEMEYVERLIADLREDQTRLDIAKGFLDRKNPSLSLVYDDLCNQSQKNESAAEMIQHFAEGVILGFSQPFAQTDTYDELLSTGNLSILSDSQIRADLMAYHSLNDTFMRRTQSRVTEYPTRFYELLPSSPELRITNAVEIWSNVRSSNICNAVTAEQNFGRFMQVGYGEWQIRKDTFLEKLTNHLSRISV